MMKMIFLKSINNLYSEWIAEYFIYDKSNNLTTYIDAAEKKTSYYYDSNHKTIRKILPDGTDIRYHDNEIL